MVMGKITKKGNVFSVVIPNSVIKPMNWEKCPTVNISCFPEGFEVTLSQMFNEEEFKKVDKEIKEKERKERKKVKE